MLIPLSTFAKEGIYTIMVVCVFTSPSDQRATDTVSDLIFLACFLGNRWQIQVFRFPLASESLCL